MVARPGRMISEALDCSGDRCSLATCSVTAQRRKGFRTNGKDPEPGALDSHRAAVRVQHDQLRAPDEHLGGGEVRGVRIFTEPYSDRTDL
jgi:hypothetical protein